MPVQPTVSNPPRLGLLRALCQALLGSVVVLALVGFLWLAMSVTHSSSSSSTRLQIKLFHPSDTAAAPDDQTTTHVSTTVPRQLDVASWMRQAANTSTDNRTESDGQNCDNKYGLAYLNRFNSSKLELCKAQQPGSSSSVTCYRHPTNPATVGSGNDAPGSIFCYMQNFILNTSSLVHALKLDPSTLDAQAAAHQITPAVKLDCNLSAEVLPWNVSGSVLDDGHLKQWLQYGLQGGAEFQGACSSGGGSSNIVIETPVLFVNRWDTENNYHHFEEIVNTFIELLLYPQPTLLKDGLMVVFTDGEPPGFYLEMWRRIGAPFQLRFLQQNPFPDGACFKSAIIAATPVRSLYTYTGIGATTKCRSPVLQAVVDWVHDLLQDIRPDAHTLPEHQQVQNPMTLVSRVMWISRRNWEATLRTNLTSWQQARMLPDEDAVVDAMQRTIREWNSRSCNRMGLPAPRKDKLRKQPGGDNSSDSPNNSTIEGTFKCRANPVYFDFMTMEPSDHRWYPEQLFMLSRTHVLIGTHGAGLANQIWLPQGTSTLIELQVNSAGNHHYHNIASMLEQKYIRVSDLGGGLQKQLERALDDTAERIYKQQQQNRDTAESR